MDGWWNRNSSLKRILEDCQGNKGGQISARPTGILITSSRSALALCLSVLSGVICFVSCSLGQRFCLAWVIHCYKNWRGSECVSTNNRCGIGSWLFYLAISPSILGFFPSPSKLLCWCPGDCSETQWCKFSYRMEWLEGILKISQFKFFLFLISREWIAVILEPCLRKLSIMTKESKKGQ